MELAKDLKSEGTIGKSFCVNFLNAPNILKNYATLLLLRETLLAVACYGVGSDGVCAVRNVMAGGGIRVWVMYSVKYWIRCSMVWVLFCMSFHIIQYRVMVMILCGLGIGLGFN